MDSVDNIKRNRRRLLIYSIILLIAGIVMGFFAYYLYDLDRTNTLDNVEATNKRIEEEKMVILAENLLREYNAYYDKIIANQETSIDYDNKKAYLVTNSFRELEEMFASNLTINEIYNYYDINDNSYLIGNSDIRPVYTKQDNNYYFDGVCTGNGNKVLFSDFKLVSKEDSKATFTYKITVVSAVDDSIAESYDDSNMTIIYENGRWKISSASITGRCGLPYIVD